MEKKKVLGLSFGRKMSNTDVMIKTALMECEKAGCEVKFIRVDDLDIKPCTGCISCVVGMIAGFGKGAEGGDVVVGARRERHQCYRGAEQYL